MVTLSERQQVYREEAKKCEFYATGVVEKELTADEIAQVLEEHYDTALRYTDYTAADLRGLSKKRTPGSFEFQTSHKTASGKEVTVYAELGKSLIGIHMTWELHGGCD